MNQLQLPYKIVRANAKIHAPQHVGDAGFDVEATKSVVIMPHERYKMPLGLQLVIPEGHVCLVQQRSSLAVHRGIDTIGNVIDAGYRGEIHAVLVNTSNIPIQISVGDRIAQLLCIPVSTPRLKRVFDMPVSDRGMNGFGSTGA